MSSYRVERTGESCRLAVNGGLTALLVPELQQVLKAEVEKGARQITFDLAENHMLDSSGIGLLIAASNTLTQRNGKLSVINTAPEITRLLRSMRLASRFNISGRPGVEHDHE
ncbi:MAG TPA: STAS domain-containing protein [Terriglobales bacterium]|nr:STAS domain-containing protein [Terriglobales bacterium]